MRKLGKSLALLVLVGGCSSSNGSSGTSEPATTSVGGTLTLSTFSGLSPTAVEAVDETGARLSAALAKDGSFHLVLARAHTYHLRVVTSSAAEPIVFPRASGKLDTTFRLSGGGAVVDLGAVRHFDAAPPSGFRSVGSTTQALSSGPAPDPADGTDPADGQDGEQDGECEDGVDATTGAVCVDDDAKASCEEGTTEEGDGDGETADDGDSQEGDDGECENGVDAKTGAACVDPEEGGDDADPAAPMAVPEHNAPDDVAGCQETEDGDGDGEEKDD